VGSTMGSHDELERLARFVVDAGIEPQVDSVRPLAQAREGFERMLQGALSGKVVFTL
jgi:D-arabinose 1-dehydrogenase-like Zn-dependent alcohol dehydrogenase